MQMQCTLQELQSLSALQSTSTEHHCCYYSIVEAHVKARWINSEVQRSSKQCLIFLISVSTSIGTKKGRIHIKRSTFNGGTTDAWGKIAPNCSPLDPPLHERLVTKARQKFWNMCFRYQVACNAILSFQKSSMFFWQHRLNEGKKITFISLLHRTAYHLKI